MRRRGVPSTTFRKQYECFTECLVLVEEAKEALVAAVPSARRPGLPLAESLSMFELALNEADARMDRWRFEGIEEEWIACRGAIVESLGRAERLRLEAPALGFEALLAKVGELMEPLDAFEGAEDTFVRLGR